MEEKRGSSQDGIMRKWKVVKLLNQNLTARLTMRWMFAMRREEPPKGVCQFVTKDEQRIVAILNTQRKMCNGIEINMK